MHDELAELSALVGDRVVAVEPCKMGFENRTAIVTLADGRRLVVQRMAGRATARHKLRLARALPARLAAVGLRAPRLLAGSAATDPPYAVREYLPGEIASSRTGTSAGAIQIAEAMGALLPRLAAVPTDGLALGGAWGSPARLASLARKYLDRVQGLLGAAETGALAATIADLPARFAGRAACFAHGDFCPVNALLGTNEREPETSRADQSAGSQLPLPSVVGLIDLEFARVADPLFDPAWWGWVVRYHHPERWEVAFPRLLAAAGIPADAANLARIAILQRLRCLEVIDYHQRTGRPGSAAAWVDRLRATIAWN